VHEHLENCDVRGWLFLAERNCGGLLGLFMILCLDQFSGLGLDLSTGVSGLNQASGIRADPLEPSNSTVTLSRRLTGSRWIRHSRCD
jgi:hypothetical protein